MPQDAWTPIRFRSVLFPTDFGPGSQTAFAHALRLAIRHRAKLTLLHVGAGRDGPDWTRFPGVRDLLERWGLLPPGSDRSDVLRETGVSVEKVSIRGRGAVRGILSFIEDHEVDLLVLATAGREGLDRLIRGSVAEPVAREAVVTTLFVPQGCRGAVDESDGSVTLDRILVPVAHRPNPFPAVDVAMNAVEGYGATSSVITLLHVGDDGMPELDIPIDARWTVERVVRSGDPAEEIVMAADDFQANLIAMTTEGRQGFLDAVSGSMTERVLRRAPCPVIAVPAE